VEKDMLNFIFLKVIKNTMLFCVLTVSITLCVASACVLPMFNDALQSRMLFLSFNDTTTASAQYSNLYSYTLNGTDKKSLDKFSNLIENNYIKQYEQPIAYFNRFYTTKAFDATDITNKTDNPITQKMAFMSMNNFKNNIKLLAGRLPSSRKNGDVEIIVSNNTAMLCDMAVGKIYDISDENKKQFRAEIVGIFDPVIGGESSVLNAGDTDYFGICDVSVFTQQFINKNFSLNTASWYYFLDFTHISIQGLPSLINTYNTQINELHKMPGTPQIVYSGIQTIKNYVSNEKSLILMLAIYLIPMFCMLIFCIFFISRLIVETDKNEISVLQSRGASIPNMLQIYFMQSFIVTIIPCILSPLLAVLICKFIGNATGFLEFGKNLPFVANVTWSVFFADLTACIIVIFTILVPCLLEFRISIVKRKLLNSEIPRKPFWKKYCLDLILLAISGYGYYNFAIRQKVVVNQMYNANQLPIDPLSFLIVLTFLTGLGLLFMRFYPVLIKLVSGLGRKVWNASVYSSLQRVKMMRDKEQFVILFIILSISLGFFSANSARTINTNLNDYIMYNGGADMVIKPIPSNAAAMENGAIEQKPNMNIYNKIKGLSGASLVSYANLPTLYANLTQIENTIIVGIDPSSYSKVVWSRPDMLGKPIYNYLSLLQKSDDACIISVTLADKMRLKVGDKIQINQNDKGFAGCYIKITAIVKAWPDYTYKQDDKGNLQLKDLIVMNYDYLNMNYGDVTYEIWAKTDLSATADSINEQLIAHSVPVYYINDYKHDIFTSISSADRQSLNALLSFSYIIILLVCFIGFALYWVLSIKSRVLQMGILRAMGMSTTGIYFMIVWEQFLISLIPSLYAVFAGYLTSRIFVDILKVSFGADKQIIPFEFFTQAGDYIKISVFFGTVFIFTFIILVLLIKRIKISQAIKFGED
jgi:putative ABC transport system permease protein